MNLKKYLTLQNLLIVVLVIICAIPLFYQIGVKPIIIWDESRNANNALEMFQNHKYLVRYFNYIPDMWEVKPPLLIWMQVLSFKIFGISEFALRLPVAICITILVISIMLFFKREFEALPAGIIASLILITSSGIIDRHIGRSADHDGVLILWLTLAVMSFYKYCDSEKNIYFLLTVLYVVLAIFTKSVIGLFVLPGLFIYALYKKKVFKILKTPQFYIILLGAFGMIFLFYYLHEKETPGYLKTVWTEEIYNRYSNKGVYLSKDSYWYYYNNFINERFIPWIYFLPFTVPAFFIIKQKRIKDLMVLIFISIVIIFLTISKGYKNLWYDAELFPLMAMLIGISIWSVYRRYFKWDRFYNIGIVLLFAILFIYPYCKIINKVVYENDYYRSDPNYAISYYLKEHMNKPWGKEKIIVCYNNYSAHLLFYLKLYKTIGINSIEMKNSRDINLGEKVIISEPDAIDEIKKKYTFVVLESYLSVSIIRINGKK